MVKEYRARVFKSGNSSAIRLPKALGFKDGEDVTIVSHADGNFSFWRKNDKLDVLMRLYGAFSPGFMSGGRGSVEQPERDWTDHAAKHQSA